MSGNVAVHTISFRGLAGAIFICLALSTVLYVIGFASVGWSKNGSTQSGLWEWCVCSANQNVPDWHRGVQAMIAIGLVGLLLAFILASIYMCVHTISKNRTLLALTVICFLSVIFMVVGFIIYGTKTSNPYWSFGISIVASILCFVAGVLSALQMRQSGVRVG